MKAQSRSQSNYRFYLLACTGGLLAFANVVSAQLWQQAPLTPPAPWWFHQDWKGIAASADFATLFAAGYPCGEPGICLGTPLYVSQDFGRTWVPTGPSALFGPIACSADGTKLMAASGYWYAGSLFMSPDAGTNWVQGSGPTNRWSAIVCSADGTKEFAASPSPGKYGDGLVYASTDSGLTWNASGVPQNDWVAFACSADGSKVFLAASLSNSVTQLLGGGDGAVYASTNSGATWIPTYAPTNQWTSVACSADGVVVLAAGDVLCLSTNSGRDWTFIDSIPLNGDIIEGVVCSADGTRLAVATLYSGIYNSSDAGLTWTSSAASVSWGAITSSADGNRLIAASNNYNDQPSLVGTWPYSGPWRMANARQDWRFAVAASTDGTKLIEAGGGAYTSVDSGATWTQRTDYGLISVASSADGNRLAAAGDLGIYTSSDSGVTWKPTSGLSNSIQLADALSTSNSFPGAVTFVACSSDASRLVAIADVLTNGAIYTSADSGTTWRLCKTTDTGLTSVASSADGITLVVAGLGGIYTSTDSGTNWNLSGASNTWTSVACSAGGRLFAASGSPTDQDPFWAAAYTYDGIYASTDSGAKWVRTSAPTNYNWQSISCSADGTKVVAVASPIIPNYVWRTATATIFISTNAGLTWVSAEAPAEGWSAVTCSGNGTNIVAVAAPGPICTLHLPVPPPPAFIPPRLSVAQLGAELRLSWVVPSASFILQQTSNLSAANWTDVPTPPTLNFINLRQELVLSDSNQGGFYRLKQR